MPKAHVLREAHRAVIAQKNGGLVECYTCRFRVATGQLVVSKSADSRLKENRIKVYHAKCWNSLFFEAS